MALGSATILLVERFLAVFAAWLVVVTVVAQAIRGRLPAEVSGRGVRYEAVTRAGLDATHDAVADIERRVDAISAYVDQVRVADREGRR